MVVFNLPCGGDVEGQRLQPLPGEDGGRGRGRVGIKEEAGVGRLEELRGGHPQRRHQQHHPHAAEELKKVIKDLVVV